MSERGLTPLSDLIPSSLDTPVSAAERYVNPYELASKSKLGDEFMLENTPKAIRAMNAIEQKTGVTIDRIGVVVDGTPRDSITFMAGSLAKNMYDIPGTNYLGRDF